MQHRNVDRIRNVGLASPPTHTPPPGSPWAEQSPALSSKEILLQHPTKKISQWPGLNPDSYFKEITELNFRAIASLLWGYVFTHFLIYCELKGIK